MTLREAAQQALEALEYAQPFDGANGQIKQAIADLQAVLEEDRRFREFADRLWESSKDASELRQKLLAEITPAQMVHADAVGSTQTICPNCHHTFNERNKQ